MMKRIPMLDKLAEKRDVAAAIIFRENKLLIGLRNYKAEERKNISVWTVPSGHCETGETLGETVMRETREETGIDDLVITDYLGKVPGAKEGDTVFLFKAETKQEPKLTEPENFSTWKWVSLPDIPSNFINPKGLELINNKLL